MVDFQGRDTGRPVLLVIPGLFAKPDAFAHLQGSLPGVDVWRGFLPGPDCASPSIEAFASAFSAALRPLRRPLAVVGVSAGALVALGLKHPSLSRLVLVEPVLRPALAWPLRSLDEPAYVEALFAGRRFSLDGLTVPATVLAGDRPLYGEGPFTGWPSLVDPESRAELEAHPLVTLRTVPGGHDLVRDNPVAFFRAVGEAASDLAKSTLRQDPVDP